jgi:hypothetical protein
VREHGAELAALTSGEELAEISRFVQKGGLSYTAADVVAVMTGGSGKVAQSA